MRHPHWKQPNPQMQAIALLGAIEGHISNIEEGLISDSSLKNLRGLVEDLRTLHAEEMPDKWSGFIFKEVKPSQEHLDYLKKISKWRSTPEQLEGVTIPCRKPRKKR